MIRYSQGQYPDEVKRAAGEISNNKKIPMFFLEQRPLGKTQMIRFPQEYISGGITTT